MPENLQTRSEHSRSMEDAEKLRAIHTLKEVGFLIPVTSLETYHGRFKPASENWRWRVDPYYKNGYNDNMNRNVNDRSALYTGDKNIAENFAKDRTKFEFWLANNRNSNNPPGNNTASNQPIGYAEMHEIVARNNDATVVNGSFEFSQITNNEVRRQYFKALRKLLIHLTDGSPLKWESRNESEQLIDALKNQKGYIVENDIDKLAAEWGVSGETMLQGAGAFNSMALASSNPLHLVNRFVKFDTDIATIDLKINGEYKNVPINFEYVQRYLRNANIVGIRQDVRSVTLGRRIFPVSFFDLEETLTANWLKLERQAVWKKFGSVAIALGDNEGLDINKNKPFLKLIENAYIKPDKLVSLAKKVEGYEEIFNSDIGNWEGYTLAEHTETVLSNFDENFADKLPVELLGPMRLAILSHDIDKPRAVANNQKYRIKAYNAFYANDFLSKLGVNKLLKELIINIIGNGKDLAFEITKNADSNESRVAMHNLAVNALTKFNEAKPVTAEEIEGFIEMCKILQICDGGAYTSMAVTRKEANESRHRNYPSFNQSYAMPVGFGKRAIRPRQPGQPSTASDLTPKHFKKD